MTSLRGADGWWRRPPVACTYLPACCRRARGWDYDPVGVARVPLRQILEDVEIGAALGHNRAYHYADVHGADGRCGAASGWVGGLRSPRHDAASSLPLPFDVVRVAACGDRPPAALILLPPGCARRPPPPSAGAWAACATALRSAGRWTTWCGTTGCRRAASGPQSPTRATPPPRCAAAPSLSCLACLTVRTPPSTQALLAGVEEEAHTLAHTQFYGLSACVCMAVALLYAGGAAGGEHARRRLPRQGGGGAVRAAGVPLARRPGQPPVRVVPLPRHARPAHHQDAVWRQPHLQRRVQLAHCQDARPGAGVRGGLLWGEGAR